MFKKNLPWSGRFLFLIPVSTLVTSIEKFFVCPFFSGISLEWRDESAMMSRDSGFEIRIEAIEVIVLKTLSIGRIRDDRDWWWICAMRWLWKISNRECDIIRDSCALRISSRYCYHLWIDIWSRDLVFSGGIGIHMSDILHTRELGSIMEGERLDAEMSIHSWSDIASEHRGFDRDRPRSAEWIYERLSIFPVRKCDECGCEIFFYRSLTCFLSISALMKRISRDIEHDMSNIIDDEYEDMDFDGVSIVRSMECGEYRLLCDWLDRRGIT